VNDRCRCRRLVLNTSTGLNRGFGGKRLIGQWENLPLSGAVSASIDAFAAAYETDEPRATMRKFLAARKARKTPSYVKAPSFIQPKGESEVSYDEIKNNVKACMASRRIAASRVAEPQDCRQEPFGDVRYDGARADPRR
jgi:hypothetical protein